MVKNLLTRQETQVRSLGQEDPLEKGMATHPSILAWRIPWTEEPGGLYSPWGCKESDMTDSYDINTDFKNYKTYTFLIFVEITNVVWLISVI